MTAMARKSRRLEQAVVLAVALVLEVVLLLAFFLQGDVEGREKRISADQLWVVTAILFFVYILYVELRVKQYGRAIVEEKVKTHTLVESLPEAVLLLDGEARIINANERACRLLAIDPLASIGSEFGPLVDAAAAERVRTGGAGRMEATAGRASRKLRLVLVPLKGDAGRMVVLEDADAGARPERPKGGAKRETSALLSSLWKSVSDLERELDGRSEETRRRFAGALILARKSLNLFDEPEAGRLSREECDVAAVAREALEGSMPVARSKNIRTELNAKGETRARVDRGLLRRALDEIIFNACSYTPEGGNVRIAVEGDGRAVTVQATDTGIGIPEEEFDRVFEAGFVGSNQTPETGSGRGVGLTFAKKIIEAHGGSIWVESRVGQGTRVSLNLPRA
jgi:two-component system sensor histidine kinase VicK